ncbi:UNVERIFIED_CONTAM: hypothetical protein GTU68_034310 [Idotea baltica]|nr:hypothetical protein [Idotea baltica]
MLKFLAKNSL